MSTIYEHDGKEIFKDEADAYEIEDIRTHYAQFDKRLVTATYTVIPSENGEPRKVIFAKKTGTKGSDLPATDGPAKFEDLLQWLKESYTERTDAEWVEWAKVVGGLHDSVESMSLEDVIDELMSDALGAVLLAHLLRQPELRRAIVKATIEGELEDWPILKGEVVAKVGGFFMVAE